MVKIAFPFGTISILGENTIHNLGVCYQNKVLIPQLSVQEHFELFGACAYFYLEIQK